MIDVILSAAPVRHRNNIMSDSDTCQCFASGNSIDVDVCPVLFVMRSAQCIHTMLFSVTITPINRALLLTGIKYAPKHSFDGSGIGGVVIRMLRCRSSFDKSDACAYRAHAFEN